MSQAQPDFVIRLLRFATQPPPGAGEGRVLLAAAIRIRNVLGRSDWNRCEAFSEPVKTMVREAIIPLQCQPHVEEHIRRQLLSATRELMLYDYPARWPQAVPQVSQIIESCMTQYASVEASATGEEAALSCLLQLRGALGVLRYCCKVYDDPLRVTVEQQNEFCSLIVPSIMVLWDFLLRRWESESIRADAESTPSSAGDLHFSAAHTEMCHCLRLCLKCLWSLCANRWPQVLCDVESFSQFFTACLQRPTKIISSRLLPIFRLRITQNLQRTNWYGDRFSDFQESPSWRVAKWCGVFMHKMVQDFIIPKHCEKRVRAAAKLFCAQSLPYIALYSLELVRWHSEPISLTSKAFIMALENLTLAVEDESCYSNIVLPAAEELMTRLLFPRFAFSTDDAELWNLNPEEYVRKQTSPAGDLFNPKVVSASLLLSVAVPTKNYHDSSLPAKLVDFTVSQLAAHSEQASQTAPGEPASPEMEAARRVDASLYCLLQLKKVVKVLNCGNTGILQDVLTRYVVPATHYPIGFLRARAVQVLSVYSTVIDWSEAQIFQQALLAVIPLLKDPETPVQVQTCVSFSLLIHHPYAWEVVNPCIADVVQQYFQVMRMIDCEAVVRTLQKTIRIYRNSLCQWAVELASMITQHFFKVAETVTGKFVSFQSSASSTEVFTEDDNFVDILMTADELLETLIVLIKSIPDSSSPAGGDGSPSMEQGVTDAVMLRVQENVAPLLFTILSYQNGSAYGFMDSALRLLTILLRRSAGVVPGLWRLIPCFYTLVTNGAADYFGQMLAPLDNYSSVEPIRFMLSPFASLCPEFMLSADPATHAAIMELTPAQMVLQMTDVVYAAPSLRLRERSSVPKICDAFLQNFWWAVTQSSDEDSLRSSSVIAVVVDAVVTSSLSRLMSLTIPSPTMRVLLANAVFSSLLADAKAASVALARANMLPSFFHEFSALVSQPGVLPLLRDYDRRLVVAAVAECIQVIHREAGRAVGECTSALQLLGASLEFVAESQMLECFANLDETKVREDAGELMKHRKEQRKTDEEDEWESEDSDTEDAAEEWDDEDDGIWDAGDEVMEEGDDGKLAHLVEQAAKMREGGALEEVDETADNLLDEDDMESPVLDKINVWMALAEVAGEAVETAVSGSLRRKDEQWAAIQRANEALRQWNEMQAC